MAGHASTLWHMRNGRQAPIMGRIDQETRMPQNSCTFVAPAPAALGQFDSLPVGGGNDGGKPVLDDWLARAVDLMSTAARNDAAAVPIDFALVGLRRQHAIAGRIVHGRHGPSLAMRRIDVADPAIFVPDAPLALSGLWRSLASPGAPAPSAAPCAAGFVAFLELHGMGDLDTLLAQSGFSGSAGQVLVALGMMLQPVMANLPGSLEHSLVLPLPAGPVYRNLVATFWMHVVAPFLARADFELALFITQVDHGQALVLGFSGASAETLCAVMDPQAARDRHITFDGLYSVDERLYSDHAIRQLSARLSQPALPLKAALGAFYSVFFAR